MADKGLVHIVDDEDAIRRSLDFLLRTAGYDIALWPDGESFLNGADGSVPACLLLDVRMPGLDGLEVQARMAAAGLDFPVIVLTGHGDIALAVRTMKAGATDFLEKPFGREKLLRSLAIGFGQIANRATQSERSQSARTQLAKLSERERQVLDGLSCGYPNRTIALDLGISARTVEVYRANVMMKLEVGSLADALRIAFAAGLGLETDWRKAHGAVQSPGL